MEPLLTSTAKLCQAWLDRVTLRFDQDNSREQLAEELVELGAGLHIADLLPLMATPGEERCYQLASVSPEGPTLYLVSDGAGVTSPPHEHQTWSVVAGLLGVERNHLYEVLPVSGRIAQLVQTRDIGAGESLALDASAVHATETLGQPSTLHLHLYGWALHMLPTFASRVFQAKKVEV